MILLMRIVTFPFIALVILCVLVVYGSDEAELLNDSYNDFFRDL